MDIIKYKDITIILDSKGNYYGFKHIATLFLNNTERAKTSIQYYNRTWEVFTYQTILNKIINILMEQIEEQKKESFKYNNNIKRLTEEKQKEVFKECNKITYYKQLKNLKKKVKNATSLYQLQK